MRKVLYVTFLAVFAISCTAQKPTDKTVIVKPAVTSPPKTAAPATVVTPKPPVVTAAGVEFYRENIGDPAKNENTISYGSIVTAKPAGYKVVKTYFPAVGQNFRQKYLILHYTALDEEKSARVLSQQSVSAHYLVNNLGNNEIYQLVDENKRAYHAGISTWRADRNLNDTSIGIEIVNPGYTVDSLNQKIFAPFDEPQFRKVAALVKDIVTRYQIPPTNVLAHSDIAPTRKQDPGPTFPWKRLYTEYQIGMWYDDSVMQSYFQRANTPNFVTDSNNYSMISKMQSALNSLGYEIAATGFWDANNRKVVEAFQYHFRPEKYDGVMDAETWAILQALVQKYPSK